MNGRFDKLKAVVDAIGLPQWSLVCGYEAGLPYLRVFADAGVCNVTGRPLSWFGRKWRLSDQMTDGEIVQTAWAAYQMAAEHEARERFTYKGVTVFDPHYDIDALVAFRSSPGSTGGREDPS